MSNQEFVREDVRSNNEPNAFHAELNQHILQQQQAPLELAAGHPGGGGGGGGAPAPRPEPPRPAPPPRPEPPPRPAPRPEPPPRPAPRPEPPPRPAPRPQPPRPEPPRPQPPRPEPHPPRPEPPHPQPPRPEPHPPKPEPHPPKPEPHPPKPEPHPPKPEPHPPKPEPHPPHPEPHPPHPEPHPPHPGPHPHPGPDPEHGGFHKGHEYHPPDGQHWGWNDRDRFDRGWDPWFFRQDPNWEQWRDPIRSEGFNIAQRLDLGDAQGAADELASDLYSMKGDRYAQDELLGEVNNNELKGVGADIQLNAWDPNRGTWDDVEILPNNGNPSIQVPVYDYTDPQPW